LNGSSSLASPAANIWQIPFPPGAIAPLQTYLDQATLAVRLAFTKIPAWRWTVVIDGA